jgi:O-antigen/teichoic acid export membrane protein
MMSQAYSFGMRVLPEAFSYRENTFAADSSVRKSVKRILVYSWPLSLLGALAASQNAAERWVLMAFASESDVGLYSVLYQVSLYPMQLVSSITIYLLSPILFANAGDGSDSQRLDRGYRLLSAAMIGGVALSILATLLALLLHGPIFSVMVAEPFQGVSYLMPVLVASGAVYALGQLGSLAILSTTRTERMLVPRLGTAGLSICFAIVGAAQYGIVGVAVANLLGSCLSTIWTWHVGLKLRSEHRSRVGG